MAPPGPPTAHIRGSEKTRDFFISLWGLGEEEFAVYSFSMILLRDHSPPYTTCVGSDKKKKHYPLASERQRDLQKGKEREICPITAGAAPSPQGQRTSVTVQNFPP
jgi:hypothetical protein